MSKLVLALIAAGAAGWSTAGCASANARQIYPGCCGPVAPTITYRTVQPQRFVTRYRDVSVYKRVVRLQPVLDVTRVRPIIRIHEVTRVYHHTVFRPVDVYDAAQPLPSVSYVAQPSINQLAQRLPSIDYVYPSVGYQPGCGCTW